MSSSNTGSPVHEKDELIARFWGEQEPDWDSADGKKIISLALDYCRKKRNIYRNSLDEQELDDLCQVTMERLISFVAKGNRIKATTYFEFLGFCKTILRNVFTDIKRKGTKYISSDALPEPGDEVMGSMPEVYLQQSSWKERIENRDLGRVIMERIRAYNPEYVIILEMSVERITMPEMMEHLKLSRNAVYKRLERARTAFRKEYEKIESEN